MKTKPNWNEAPEGAQVWMKKTKNFGAFWAKYDGEKWVIVLDDGSDDDWGTSAACNNWPIPRPTVNQQLTDPVVKESLTAEEAVCSKMEPTTWNGQGLPPVGTVCESYCYSTEQWIEGKVLMHGHQGECAFAAGNETSWIKLFWGSKFRPLETDRERWIDDALKVMLKYNPNTSQLGELLRMAKVLYDAGLAKLPE